MNFLRPQNKSTIQKQISKALGIAILLACLPLLTTHFAAGSADAATLTSPNWNFNTQTWNLSGSWRDCNGSIDNDSAHHSLNFSDTDPAHHLGMVCNGSSEVWSEQNFLTMTGSTATPLAAVSTNTATLSTTSQINGPIPPAMTESIARAKGSTQTVITTMATPLTGAPTNSGNPFAGSKLYVNSYNDPANYVRANAGTYNAQLMSKIAGQPEVEWLGGWNSNISSDVSNMMNAITGQGALPVFATYNIPGRDCGGYSQGGASDAASYNSWISQIASAIGNRKAVVIMEPDALSLIDCLSASQLSDRYTMLRNAISTFKKQGNIAVYLDAGHPNWISASDMASRLKNAGLDSANGFVLNISNFFSTADNTSYGTQISNLTGGTHFIIDTGRNGAGPTADQQWCNPSGRSLGNPPTVNTGNALVDAYLWVKGPGGSDGNCNGGPAAGQFWPDYALGLASRTNW